jgi:peptidoglycan L-alanyl-D-glutamate endopeptidase CwlK
MQVLFNRFFDRCRRDLDLLKIGVTVLLTCTWRSHEEQDKLYAQGRTTPGRIVTRARAGHSKHNTVDERGAPAAEAFDVVPLLHGKPVWDDVDNPDTPEDEAWIWERVGEHGKAVGLKWYGDPESPFREKPHFQNPEV